MEKEFTVLRQTRKNILEATKDLSLEAINKTHPNFNNNIGWNLAHILVTQELLCYKLSGLDMHIDEDFTNKYRKGSRPESMIDQKELNFIRTMLAKTPDILEADYNSKKFENYTPYTSSYNVTLDSVETAILFNNVHEGLHFGYIMALKRLG